MFHAQAMCRPISGDMDTNGNLVQIREAARLCGCSRDSLRRWSRAGLIESRRGANGYRLFDAGDLAKLLNGKVKRPRRVALDRVHQASFLKNTLVDNCVQLVFMRPPTADARAGVHPDRFVGFMRPYLEDAKRILATKGSLILCAKESSRRSRDLYLVDLIRVVTEEIGLRLIDEFCWVRSRVAPTRLGPRRLPDGWMRCLHFSLSSSPDTFPEQVESRNGNGKSVTVSPANVLVMPPQRGVEFDADTPVGLVEHFIRYCTTKGAVVCDPLATLATPLAAMTSARRYICFQPNKAKYHAIMAAVAEQEEKDQADPPVNEINDLSSSEWMRFGASVWSAHKNSEERRITTDGEHPAVMPVELCTRLIRCLLSTQDVGPVLDPFSGAGSTLVAARQLGKRGIGLDVNEQYVYLAKQRVEREATSSAAFEIHHGDAKDVAKLVEHGSVSMVLTSPPFWNILEGKRTVDERPVRTYGKANGCLSRVRTYPTFVKRLAECFQGIEVVMRPGAPCVVEVMDLARGPDFFPFHLDLCQAIRDTTGLQLVDTVIWDRTNDFHNHRPIGWGQRWLWRHVHSYLLIFRKSG